MTTPTTTIHTHAFDVRSTSAPTTITERETH